jgi:MarR family 2-MHQ and catechol resistance regulon transcriptional repressor
MKFHCNEKHLDIKILPLIFFAMESGAHIRLILWKTERAVERVDLRSMVDTGLGASDFAILEALLHKGPLQIGQIGEKVLLTSGSMTAAVNRLEQNGLVKRSRTIKDARCCAVALTRKGRNIIEPAYARHAENLEKVASVLTSDERSELVRLLKKLGTHAARISLEKQENR